MPPEGKRKKKYEQELRRVQNRNFFAALVLIIAIVASVLLIRWVFVGTKPQIFLSVNRIDHSGTREIPFSEESCQVVTAAFQDHLSEDNLKCNPEGIQELDEENSKLYLDSSITEQDVLIVYLNGHLLATPDDQEVFWVGPESERLLKRNLSELLSAVDASRAKTKIVMLDAGRYSWSPGFPGRKPNPFQSALNSLLKTDQWGRDLWVITSHSDYEISNVSTPLRCSLFAQAISETLATLSGQSDEIPVVQLYDEIRKRTQSYARNFNNKSLQHPILIRGSVGQLEAFASDTGSSNPDPLRVIWKTPPPAEESEDGEPTPEKTYPISDFAQAPEEYAKWLFQTDHYAALPNQSLRSLERFIELGNLVDGSLDWPTSDEKKVETYSQRLTESTRQPSGPPIRFNREQLQQKQQRVKKFQTALLELSILLRLRDQMRFWDDNAYNAVPRLPALLAEPVQVDDNALTSDDALPTSLIRWFNVWEDFRQENVDDLFSIVYRKAADSDPLTPLQAELLGVLTQRYLKLIQPAPTEDEPSGSEAISNDIKITLKIDYKGRFNPSTQPLESDPGAGYKSVVEESIAETEQFRNAVTTADSDTARRYQLAAVGAEFAEPFDGTLPNIAWEKITPEITIEPIAQKNLYQVNPYEKIPIKFSITASAVEKIDLKIEPTGDQLEGLNFGVGPEFKTKLVLADLDPTADVYRKQKTIEVYFHYPQFDPAKVSRTFSFEITATDGNLQTVSDRFPLNIEITEEPTYWLKSERVLANKNDDRQAQLVHFGTKIAERDWQPLVIRTLANVKSAFKLRLQNNAAVSRSFRVKLFKIKKLPDEIGKNLLRADRVEWEQAHNFSQWMANQSLRSEEYFELIAQASIDDLAPKDTKPIAFELPPPDNPEEKQPDPETPVQVEIEHGAVIAFYTADQPDNPEWFQMVRFEPRDSADLTASTDRLRLRSDIEGVFGPKTTDLKDHLAPILSEKSPTPTPAARLTIVSQDTLDNNEHQFKTFKLDEVLNNARFAPGEATALLLLDSLGVPNYATYEVNGSSVENTPLRQRLIGIHAIDAPDGWTCNPQTWSFASSPRTVAPFEWLAGDANQVIDFFIRMDDQLEQPQPANKDLSLEVFLPLKNVDALSLRIDDYWWRWNASKTPLLYPNKRKHFFEISGQGVTAWSTITAHEFTISDPANQVLEIGQGDQTLGRWKFVTQSLNISPSVEANQKKCFNKIPDLKAVQIKVDVAKIKPVVTAGQVKLNLNGKPVKEVAEFLARHERESGKFEFSLYDIISQAEEPLPEEKTEMEIEVEVVDFFGKQTRGRTMITVAPKPIPKPPPKPVTLVVNLILDEKPADLFSFDKVIMNKKTIPLNRFTPLNGGQVKITGNKTNSTLTIEGLLPGTYDLAVTAKVKPTGEAIYTSRTASTSKIKVAEGQPAVTIEFTQ